ncbi:MAG TPA: RHS repeat domain-containing protein, partial [Roseateles sp.]
MTALDGYKLLSGYVTAPTSATQIRVQVFKGATSPGESDSYLFVASMTAQAANPLSDNPADWRPVPSLNDRVSYFKYDAAGRKIADIDAAGATTEYSYDAAGRITKTTQYAHTAQNLLGNDNFLAGTQGFAAYSPDAASISFGNHLSDDWSAAGQGTLWLRQTNNAQLNSTADAAIFNTGNTTSVTPGQRYYVSAKVGVHRAAASLRVIFLDAAGQFVGGFLQPSGGQTDMGVQEAIGGSSIAGYKLLSGYVTA